MPDFSILPEGDNDLFEPSYPGGQVGTLSISSNDPDTPGLEIDILGYGTETPGGVRALSGDFYSVIE